MRTGLYQSCGVFGHLRSSLIGVYYKICRRPLRVREGPHRSHTLVMSESVGAFFEAMQEFYVSMAGVENLGRVGVWLVSIVGLVHGGVEVVRVFGSSLLLCRIFCYE